MSAAPAGHPAHGGAERGRLGSVPAKRELPLWSLELAMVSSSPRSWSTSSPDVPHLRLVHDAVGALHGQLPDPLQDVHGAAQVALRAGQGVAHGLDVLAVAVRAHDLGLESRGTGRRPGGSSRRSLIRDCAPTLFVIWFMSNSRNCS